MENYIIEIYFMLSVLMSIGATKMYTDKFLHKKYELIIGFMYYLFFWPIMLYKRYNKL